MWPRPAAAELENPATLERAGAVGRAGGAGRSTPTPCAPGRRSGARPAEHPDWGCSSPLLIFLSVPPIYLFDTFVPLLIGAPLIAGHRALEVGAPAGRRRRPRPGLRPRRTARSRRSGCPSRSAPRSRSSPRAPRRFAWVRESTARWCSRASATAARCACACRRTRASARAVRGTAGGRRAAVRVPRPRRPAEGGGRRAARRRGGAGGRAQLAALERGARRGRRTAPSASSGRAPAAGSG